MKGKGGAVALTRREWMVDEDPPIVVDDQKLEAARKHRLALGEQHLPAERHDIAAKARAGGGAKADALVGGVLSGVARVSLASRGVSAPPGTAGASGAQSAAMADERLAASGSFQAAT